MKKQKIEDIISKQWAHTSNLCEHISPGFEKEEMHKFRVAFKTLRSFLRLLRLQNPDDKLNIPKKIKHLYHIAGALRDAQLEIEQLEKRQWILPAYSRSLHLLINQKMAEWDQAYDKAVLQKFTKSISAYNFKSLPQKTFDRFLKLRLKHIAEVSLLAAPTDNEVHYVRKQLKDTLYTSKVAKEKWDSLKEKIKKIPVNELDQLADLIGKYNDNRIAIEHLASFASRKLNPEEDLKIRPVCDAEIAKLIEEKKDILSGLKKSINWQI
jgi:CHAD domain-containing protein